MNKLIYSLIILFSIHTQTIGAAALFSGAVAVGGTVLKTGIEAKELLAGTIKVAGPVIKAAPSLVATAKTALASGGAALTSVVSQAAPVAQALGSGALSIVQGVNTVQQAAATTLVGGMVVGKVVEKLSGKPSEKILSGSVAEKENVQEVKAEEKKSVLEEKSIQEQKSSQLEEKKEEKQEEEEKKKKQMMLMCTFVRASEMVSSSQNNSSGMIPIPDKVMPLQSITPVEGTVTCDGKQLHAQSVELPGYGHADFLVDLHTIPVKLPNLGNKEPLIIAYPPNLKGKLIRLPNINIPNHGIGDLIFFIPEPLLKHAALVHQAAYQKLQAGADGSSIKVLLASGDDFMSPSDIMNKFGGNHFAIFTDKERVDHSRLSIILGSAAEVATAFVPVLGVAIGEGGAVIMSPVFIPAAALGAGIYGAVKGVKALVRHVREKRRQRNMLFQDGSQDSDKQSGNKQGPGDGPQSPNDNNKKDDPSKIVTATRLGKLSQETVEEAVKWFMRNKNKIDHIFEKAQHNLAPLVAKLGSKEAVVRAVLENTPSVLLPSAGKFEDVPVVVEGFTVLIRGFIDNGIPKLGTFFIR